jgi:hypothetical protein
MAEINITRLENKIAAVEAAAKRIERDLERTDHKLDSVVETITEVSEELAQLKESFEIFVSENRKATALQKAATELVRVRQELEQNYGSYKVVRETMLGVLQATDLALVKKTTIAQVTEELMLSTPDYWLAPCLVAVSAWIGNDRDLAERAIAEAIKRDEEKTALTMALICRRNNRTDTCYEWLSIYFAHQSATNFTESNFTYLSAYINGVFGPDDKHMCDDYVAKWLKEIQDNGDDLEAKQTELWKEYCSEFTVDLEGQFPQMANCVHEYSDIAAYVSRINAVEGIRGNFSKIKQIEVDQQKLKKDIDQTLVSLISRYDVREEPLRKEERYLKAVRYFDGDTAAAKASILEADRKRTEETIDLLSQMTNVIVKKEGSKPSERKTAMSFLGSYIRSGFSQYITEKKASFPTQISLEVNGWTGTTTDGSNVAALQADYAQHMETQRQQKLNAVKEKRPKQLKIAAIGLGVVGIVFLFIVSLIGVLCIAGAVGCFIASTKAAKNIVQTVESTNAEFDEKIASGKQQINDTLNEWNNARALVDTFERAGIPDVVA